MRLAALILALLSFAACIQQQPPPPTKPAEAEPPPPQNTFESTDTETRLFLSMLQALREIRTASSVLFTRTQPDIQTIARRTRDVITTNLKFLDTGNEKIIASVRQEAMSAISSGAILGRVLGTLTTHGEVIFLGGTIGSAIGSPKIEYSSTAKAVKDVSEQVKENTENLAKTIQSEWRPNTPVFSCYADYLQCTKLNYGWHICGPALWLCCAQTMIPTIK